MQNVLMFQSRLSSALKHLECKRRFWYTEYVYNFLLKGFPETDIITTEHNCCFKFIYRRDDQ